jgi:hypothetical protein
MTAAARRVQVAASQIEMQMSEEGNQSPEGKSRVSLCKLLSAGEERERERERERDRDRDRDRDTERERQREGDREREYSMTKAGEKAQ